MVAELLFYAKDAWNSDYQRMYMGRKSQDRNSIVL